MTQQEAHALVQRECRRRQRKGKRGPWGAQNAEHIKAMHDEMTFLHEHPSIARRIGSMHFATRIAMPDSGGAYVNIRRPGRTNQGRH